MLVLVIALLETDTLLRMQGVAGILAGQGTISDRGFGRWSRVAIERFDSVEHFVRGLVVEERIVGVHCQIVLVSSLFDTLLRILQLALQSCGLVLSLNCLLFLLLYLLLFSRYPFLPSHLVLCFLVFFLVLISPRLSCPTTSGRRLLSCAAGYLVVSISLSSFHIKEGRNRDQTEVYGEGEAGPVVRISI